MIEEPKNRSYRGVVWAIAIFLGLLILVSLGNKKEPTITAPSVTTTTPAPPQSTPPVKESKTIDASVRFTETQLIITNTDDYNWTKVKMTINGGVFSGGFDLEHPLIEHGTTYTVGVMQFADSDGKRFNPYQMKLLKIMIVVQPQVASTAAPISSKSKRGINKQCAIDGIAHTKTNGGRSEVVLVSFT